jgi:Holliday junction resolvase RusA-like endonuclease
MGMTTAEYERLLAQRSNVATPSQRAKRGTGRVGRAKAVACAAVNADAGREPIRLVLPYPPGVNALYCNNAHGRHLSKKGRAFKAEVAALAAGAGLRPFKGDVVLTIAIYRPIKAADLDGRLKSAIDALTGFAYDDDSQIVRIVAERFEDRENPRAEVTVRAA